MTAALHTLAAELAGHFGAMPGVRAVALGGSLAAGAGDAGSDIDLYVYTDASIPPEARGRVIEATGGAMRLDLGQDYWGLSDQWVQAGSGTEIDIVYFDANWMEAGVRSVLLDYRPSMGYTTCFAHTIRQSRVLHDPTGWLAGLRALTAAPYPEPLRRAIIDHNQPVLRGMITSYRAQIAKAIGRGDLVSVNHRLAALLASYFDIVFAFNRVYHPGEKRLLERAQALCARLPRDMAADVTAVLVEGGNASAGLLPALDRLLDRLDEMLAEDDGAQKRKHGTRMTQI